MTFIQPARKCLELLGAITLNQFKTTSYVYQAFCYSVPGKLFSRLPNIWGLNISCETKKLPMYYILKGRKIKAVSSTAWETWFGNVENRRVGSTYFPGGRVSTVFVGLEPIYFET